MPANDERESRERQTQGASLSPAELQFGLALRMLKASTDNMQVAFDALLRSRSAQTPRDSESSEAPSMETPGRPVFGARAARAVEAGEKLQAQEEATGSDAAPSSTPLNL